MGRQIDLEKHRPTDREADRQTKNPTDRQTDICNKYRQADRLTDKHVKTIKNHCQIERGCSSNRDKHTYDNLADKALRVWPTAKVTRGQQAIPRRG